jgi:dTDP-glucose 4,6-dehydratase
MGKFFPDVLNTPVPDQLAGKRIFITGGTGLFGRWLLEEFSGIDVDLVLLTRDPAAFRKGFPMVGRLSTISFVEGDVRNFSFPSGHFNYVIHAATPVVSDDLSDDADEMYSIIVDGTERVLEFSEAAGVNRLLYVSSGAVYGVQPPEVEYLPETYPCNPVTAYGKGKLAAEQLCLESGIPAVIARCFAFVGPYLPDDAHFAIGNFIGNCLRDEPIEIKGDGTPLRSYMYGSDLAKWLLCILMKGISGAAYNVGSDAAVSIESLAHLVRDIAGTKNKIAVHGTPVPGEAPSRYIPSIEKERTELGLDLQINLREAIVKTLDWHRNQ